MQHQKQLSQKEHECEAIKTDKDNAARAAAEKMAAIQCKAEQKAETQLHETAGVKNQLKECKIQLESVQGALAKAKESSEAIAQQNESLQEELKQMKLAEANRQQQQAAEAAAIAEAEAQAEKQRQDNKSGGRGGIFSWFGSNK